MTSFNARFSKLRSAYICFSLRFSRSSSLSGLISEYSMSPYVDFQLEEVVSEIPCSRHTSLRFRLPSICLRMLTIYPSVNREFLIRGVLLSFVLCRKIPLFAGTILGGSYRPIWRFSLDTKSSRALLFLVRQLANRLGASLRNCLRHWPI